MLDTSQLKKGDRCLYKKFVLIYQDRIAGRTPYHLFHTLKGTVKRLSEPVTQKEVWLEISAE